MIATKELVKLALCYIILMVSLSKCEIDSSSSITTTTTATAPLPGKAQPEEETDEKTLSTGRSFLNNSGFSLPFPEKTVKTSFSIYSSSSSFDDEAVPTAFNNNVSEQWQKQHIIGQQQADGPNNANIISGTTTPSPASEILTSPALLAPPQQQEVEDSDKEEVAQQQAKWGQQREPSSEFAAIPNKNKNDNKRQTVGKAEVLSSSFRGSDALSYSSNINAQNYFETMSEFGSHFPESKINSRTAASGIPVEPDTISIHSADSSSSLSRGNAVPFYGIRGRRTNTALSSAITGKSNQNESVSENGSDSLIPTSTWIPAELTFSCKNRYPGYYTDPSPISKCQVYHMCMTDGRKYTLLCGIGTVFNQLTFVCDHWYNYKCSEAESDYKINRQLWDDVFSEDDDPDNKPDDELENYDLDNRDQKNGGMELKENLAVQSLPSRSHFMVTNRIRKSRVALS